MIIFYQSIQDKFFLLDFANTPLFQLDKAIVL